MRGRRTERMQKNKQMQGNDLDTPTAGTWNCLNISVAQALALGISGISIVRGEVGGSTPAILKPGNQSPDKEAKSPRKAPKRAGSGGLVRPQQPFDYARTNRRLKLVL